MNTDEIIRALRNHANMDKVTAKSGLNCHAAADLLESQQARIAALEAQLAADRARYAELQQYNVDCTKQCGALLVEKIDLRDQLAESQRRERAAETAMEKMTYIIQKAAYRRCDYCIYRTEPCQARGLYAECDFEYVGERGPQETGEGEAE